MEEDVNKNFWYVYIVWYYFINNYILFGKINIDIKLK